MKTITSLATLGLCGALGVACASSTVPASRMATTEASIRTASEVGAQQNPTAALHLRFAQEQYAQAQRLNNDGEGERAQMVLRRAEADAELALALSRESGAQAQAQAALDQVHSLQQQGR